MTIEINERELKLILNGLAERHKRLSYGNLGMQYTKLMKEYKDLYTKLKEKKQ